MNADSKLKKNKDCLMSNELGIYDTLHDDIFNGAEFSKLIKGKTSEYYGMAAEAFLLQLIENNIDVENRFLQLKRELEEEMLPEKTDGQVHRVADLFVLYTLIPFFIIKYP